MRNTLLILAKKGKLRNRICVSRCGGQTSPPRREKPYRIYSVNSIPAAAGKHPRRGEPKSQNSKQLRKLRPRRAKKPAAASQR